MTKGRASENKHRVTLVWLPWIMGAAALAWYAFTLNHSLAILPDWMVLLGAAPAGARTAGWLWQPEFLSPAYYAITLPLRLLPERLIPLATNFFSALCGALALGQLARSVALLPHDRTLGQRERIKAKNALLNIPLAWLPPVFAVLVCGLELSFWEHGTNGTVEMFDLLLFSYVVRSLLEYRIDLKENRLFGAAFVFGVGITSNHAMIAFFPLFAGALVWTRKLGFFNRRFLGRMALYGLAGLLLYLLLPTIGALSQANDVSFWQLLRSNLQWQKSLLLILPKKDLLVLSVTYLLPLFVLSIRWASQFGDTSRIGVILTTIVFHVVHVVILVACLWMALDPDSSPRKAGGGFVFLPFYYLGALCVGYYSGYLLLVFRAVSTRLRAATSKAVALQNLATGFVIILFFVVPASLAYRNFVQIRLTNGKVTEQFAADLIQGLPQKNGVILSDDSQRLWLLQDQLARLGRSGDFILLCTAWLPYPAYHEYLKTRYTDWPSPAKPGQPEQVKDSQLVLLMQQLAKDHELCYLHGSFGFYFEFFADTPFGLVYQLTPWPTKSLLKPPLAPEVVSRNEQFWAKAKAGTLQRILAAARPRDPASGLNAVGKFFKAIQLKPIRNSYVSTLGLYYSRALVAWADELQKLGDYEKAAQDFELAEQLNPNNAVAKVNLEFNRKYRAGQPVVVETNPSITNQFGNPDAWQATLRQFGPYDEPSFTYAQGQAFAGGGLFRQAAQAFARVRGIATNDVGSRLWLAQFNLNLKLPAQTLELTREIRDILKRSGDTKSLPDLFTLEAAAYFSQKESATATQIIERSIAQNPDNIQLLAAACHAYSENGLYTNALDVTRRILRLTPDDPNALLNQGCFQVQLNDYTDAVASFNRVLTIATNHPTALFYRAVALLRGDQLDLALKDYEALQRQYPKAHQMYYGLGEIAYRRKDTNTAIRHYEAYLANSPTNNPESVFVLGRLQELKGIPPQ